LIVSIGAPSLGAETPKRRITTQSGAQFFVRPIRPDDAEAYESLVETLSAHDRRFRFFSAWRELPGRLRESLTRVDHINHEAFVAVSVDESEGALCGIVRLIKRSDPGAADFAIVVSQDLRNKGLGYSLMQYIVDYAKASGVERLCGTVLSDNRAMLKI
jgi:acetyltransferase